MLEVGSIIDGKYKILNKVGQGGMSVVYLAMNERANKQWAVKEVRKDGVLDFESVKQGLVAETNILKQLSHKHLPSIIDVIDTPDSFIIIMDYVQGNSLDKSLKEFGAQPEEDVIEWSKQLCDVLGYLHNQNPPIIYRDMKPANVMLKPDGEVSLIDFGTARYQKAGKIEDTTCLGTRGYAAPEQYGGMGQTDARTDIYCLGATIYHLVTGMNPSQPPYEIRPITEINPTLSTGLEEIILKCTQNNPADRYQTCEELAYDLENYKIIDKQYKKKQANKLKAFALSLMMAVVFAVVSVAFYFVSQNEKKASYDYMLGKSNSVEEYCDTILLDPTRTEAYLGTEDFKGLIEFLVSDGDTDVLDTEGHRVLLSLKTGIESEGSGGFSNTTDVLAQLKDADEEGYQKVCYEIGETYLFYYDVGVEKDKYQAAASWFKESIEEYPVAQVYCDISNCMQNVAKYQKANQTAKLYNEYKELWGKIIVLKDECDDFEEDIKIQVWTAIVKLISENCKEFCEVSSVNEISSVLNNLSKTASSISSTFLQKDISKLNLRIDETLSKVKTVSK